MEVSDIVSRLQKRARRIGINLEEGETIRDIADAEKVVSHRLKIPRGKVRASNQAAAITVPGLLDPAGILNVWLVLNKDIDPSTSDPLRLLTQAEAEQYYGFTSFETVGKGSAINFMVYDPSAPQAPLIPVPLPLTPNDYLIEGVSRLHELTFTGHVFTDLEGYYVKEVEAVPDLLVSYVLANYTEGQRRMFYQAEFERDITKLAPMFRRTGRKFEHVNRTRGVYARFYGGRS